MLKSSTKTSQFEHGDSTKRENKHNPSLIPRSLLFYFLLLFHRPNNKQQFNYSLAFACALSYRRTQNRWTTISGTERIHHTRCTVLRRPRHREVQRQATIRCTDRLFIRGSVSKAAATQWSLPYPALLLTTQALPLPPLLVSFHYVNCWVLILLLNRTVVINFQ